MKLLNSRFGYEQHKKAENYLKNSFELKKIRKSYLAWIDGKLTEPFFVDMPIKINDDYSETKHKVFVHGEGKHAHTDFTPLHYDEALDATLIACYPLTGRTHQIRIHLFHVKHPILGDPIYGPGYATAEAYLEERLSPEERLRYTGASRLMLHAYSVKFEYKNRYFLVSRDDFSAARSQITPPEAREFNCYSEWKTP